MIIDYETQFETLPAHMMMLDGDLRFIAANAAFRRNTGLRRDQILGKYVFDLFPAPDEMRQPIEDAFKRTLNGEPTNLEEIRYSIAGEDGRIEERFWTVSHIPGFDVKGDVTHLVQIGEDVTAAVRSRRFREAVLREMQHRVGNTFAQISAMARMTARNETTMDAFLSSFEDRLNALAQAQSLLTGENWTGASLEDLVRQHLKPYLETNPDRISVTGPTVYLRSDLVPAFAMALHELTTNAAKHGALRDDKGALAVSWSGSPERDFALEWRETGVAGVRRAERIGFGQTILTEIFPRQLEASAKSEVTIDGFRYALTPAAD